jgi:DNA-directed RNA polymerase specialized sigma24 family protein
MTTEVCPRTDSLKPLLSFRKGRDLGRRSILMMTKSRCDCLVCRLEANLIAELSDDGNREQFRSFSLSSPVLSAFCDPPDLIRKLHDFNNHAANSDHILLELLRQNSDAFLRPLLQKLLLLVFIPTVHRTTSQVSATFPSLTREDIAQHLFIVLLEILDSSEMAARHSHLAFTISRKMRRSAFRWAIRESRGCREDETGSARPLAIELETNDEVLQEFLDSCQQRGWLSIEERRLLTQFKLEGVSGPELSLRSGHSAVAVRHRVQRIVSRLRRIARAPVQGGSEQLNLFLPRALHPRDASRDRM